VQQAIRALAAVCPQALPLEQRAVEAYAAALIGDYLSEGWRDKLVASMGLSSQDVGAAGKRDRGVEDGTNCVVAQADAGTEPKKTKVCSKSFCCPTNVTQLAGSCSSQ
jgi:hypothetical protein